GGRVDGHVPRRQPRRQRMHEELDPTWPRRKVIGQNKDLRHGAALPRIAGPYTCGPAVRPDGNGKILKHMTIRSSSGSNTTGGRPPGPASLSSACPSTSAQPPPLGSEGSPPGPSLRDGQHRRGSPRTRTRTC